ncbi:MAG: GGDEF domain-containing protein [Rhodopseudomonas palustris]|uniref:GGDEF domain-containing protein n=1 Tax=Rhodopseudomonas palustris TaxID=1076 RepID=A0A933VXI8_RHOPL|nr:GGDEF domain-containing protein [Rhodopseudomonas palustris]
MPLQDPHDPIVETRLIRWLINGPRPQPDVILRRLLLQSQTKTRTLLMAMLSTTMFTVIAALLTGAAWAYLWIAIEIAFGTTRYIVARRMRNAQASDRPSHGLPIYLGLAWALNYTVGCSLCVLTGDWPLMLFAGIVIAGLSGAFVSRHAGTPRYGIALIAILAVPYTLAMVFSSVQQTYLIGLLIPGWGLGMAALLFENYDVLLHLFLSERENKWLANYDQLTGLPNRTMLHRRFEELLRHAAGTSTGGAQPLTVLWLDLDGFKAANDRYGHEIGDAVLVVVAQRLRSCVRGEDLIFRVGGDEFVILLPATEAADSVDIAERLIARIAEPIDLGKDVPLNIGVSIGSATFPRDGQTADDLLRSADSAMYEAKRLGKGGVVHCDSIDDAPSLVPELDPDSPAPAKVRTHPAM